MIHFHRKSCVLTLLFLVPSVQPSHFTLAQFARALESASEQDKASLLCANGQVPVPLRHIAPDLALSGLGVLTGVKTSTLLGTGGFGRVPIVFHTFNTHCVALKPTRQEYTLTCGCGVGVERPLEQT